MTKLIYCTNCKDIIKLIYNEERFCRCGMAHGMYTHGGNAVIRGQTAVAIGLANEDLRRARLVSDNPRLTDLLRCWFIRPGAYDWNEITIERKIAKEDDKL